MKYAANLSTLFPEVDFLCRFNRAHIAGFRYVEFLFPYAYSQRQLKNQLETNQLEMALFNAPPGHWDKGERGLAALKGRESEFLASIDSALEYAVALSYPKVHVMAGIIEPDDRERAKDIYMKNIEYTAEQFKFHDIEVLLEPLNTFMKLNYLISSHLEMAEIVRELNLENVKLQFDLYHAQIMHGNITKILQETQDIIGHIQVASVPSLQEPTTEELNFPYFCQLFEKINYHGCIGLEYHPKEGTEAGLSLLDNLISK